MKIKNKLLVPLLCMIFLVVGCSNTITPKNKAEGLAKIKSINGSATAYLEIDRTTHSVVLVFLTIHLYDDLTCEIENFKQPINSSSTWPPSEPNIEWNYLYDAKFENCNYVISDPDIVHGSDDQPFYQLTIFALMITEDEEKDMTYMYSLQLNEDSTVYSLTNMLSETKEVYYFEYKNGKNFGDYEKERHRIQKEEKEERNQKFIGTWSNDNLTLSLKDDGTCYISSVDASDCTWYSWPSSPDKITLEYKDKYGNRGRDFLIKENLSQLNEIFQSDSSNILKKN